LNEADESAAKLYISHPGKGAKLYISRPGKGEAGIKIGIITASR